jgi:hypothetical protein
MTPNQLIHLIDHTVQVTQVLDINNYSYGDLPAQIPCPVHKGGNEIKYSARVYSDGLYCFRCGVQYKATEIHAAIRHLDREDAARELLARFPPTDEQKTAALKEYYAPKVKPLPQALIDRAEATLRNFRHRVPLEPYRVWAARLDGLGPILRDTEPELQLIKLTTFRNQMIRELTHAHREGTTQGD